MRTESKLLVKNISYIILIFILSASTILVCLHMFLQHSEKSYAVKPLIQVKVYSILIDTDEKRLYLLCNGNLIKRYTCAVGKNETPSPLGSYKITQKSHWGEGFGGYWLGINCPWGNYGIHGTTKPETVGLSTSHGCFRMYNSDIEELFKIVPYGTAVCITGGCYGAFGNGSRKIGPNMYGLDVETVQIRLKKEGYFNGYCNGRYESDDFKFAIHRFQKDHGLAISDYINKKMLTALGFIMMD